MFESLRARLIAWYTLLLAAVIVALGSTMCYLSWRTHLGRIDATLTSRADELARALVPAAGGTFDLTLPAARLIDASDASYHVIWTDQGDPIDRSDPDRAVPAPSAPGVRSRDGYREVVVRASAGPLVLVGESLATARAELWSLAGTVAALGLAALSLSFAGGWWILGRGLQPVTRIGKTAKTMIGGDFTARIPVDRVETELEQLAGALNDAFDKLHGSLQRQRRFTADASHELRTPLATLSTEVQWALSRERRPEEYRQALEASRRAAGRMQTIVERLLALARAEAGADIERRIPVQLDDLTKLVVNDLKPLADARRITVSVDASPSVVQGDPDQLFDAITNVVTNAIGYNVDGGHVAVTLAPVDGRVELSVTDTGIGVAPEDLPRIFEPFFRSDPRRTPGAGLGLAVTRAIVESHRGEVSCSSGPGSGTTLTITLDQGEIRRRSA